MTATAALRWAEGLDTLGLGHIPDVTDRLFTAQRPYRNGVTVYNRSVWGGNGFGTDVTKVAVRDGEIVGIYDSGRTSRAARVLGQPGNIYADRARTARGETYVTRTALSKWVEAVKALPKA